MTNLFAFAFVAVAGALNAVQSGANAQLVRALGRPWLVGLVVSLITAAAFLAGFVLTGARLPATGKDLSAPWWAWTGGLCGAMYVMATLFFAERLGAALFTGLSITAAIIASILVEHFGLAGFQPHPASLPRLAGAALMVAGLVLVARF